MTTKYAELIAIANTLAGEDVSGEHPRTVAGAIDAITDALAGEDIDSGGTIASAIAALAPYAEGGGGGGGSTVPVVVKDVDSGGSVIPPYAGSDAHSTAHLATPAMSGDHLPYWEVGEEAIEEAAPGSFIAVKCVCPNPNYTLQFNHFIYTGGMYLGQNGTVGGSNPPEFLFIIPATESEIQIRWSDE